MSDRARIGVFDNGFRVFFLLAPLYGALAVVVWMAELRGWLPMPLALPPALLHAHEMVFGFAGAALAGFFLTAVPNWTGAKVLCGTPLAGLAATWLAGRVAMAAFGVLPPGLAAMTDLAFLPALALTVIGPLLAAGKQRNLVLLVPLALFWGADAAMQAQFANWTGADIAGTAVRVGIDILLLLITVIGGRIVPTFTGNVLRAFGEAVLPRSLPALDRAAIGAMVLLIIAEASGITVAIGAVAALACVLNAVRLSLWRGIRIVGSPILWVLHLGYLWLVVGLGLKAVAAFSDQVPETAALHALTVGAIGTMIFAVMSRAGLGHTGRPLKVHAATVLAYVLVSAAALLRVAASLAVEWFALLLGLSTVAWAAASLLFLAAYTPILLPRDRHAGDREPTRG